MSDCVKILYFNLIFHNVLKYASNIGSFIHQSWICVRNISTYCFQMLFIIKSIILCLKCVTILRQIKLLSKIIYHTANQTQELTKAKEKIQQKQHQTNMSTDKCGSWHGHQLTWLFFPVASAQLFLKNIYPVNNHFHVNPTETDLQRGHRQLKTIMLPRKSLENDVTDGWDFGNRFAGY